MVNDNSPYTTTIQFVSTIYDLRDLTVDLTAAQVSSMEKLYYAVESLFSLRNVLALLIVTFTIALTSTQLRGALLCSFVMIDLTQLNIVWAHICLSVV